MLIIGHRGAAGIKPENTLASIQKAFHLGVDMVEFDVRVCKSGQPILNHDASFLRTAKLLGWVNKMNLDEIKRIKFEGQYIPTLKEALELVDGKIPVNIEIKDGSRQIAEAVKLFLKKKPLAKVLISSKNKSDVEEMQKLLPALTYGYVSAGVFFKDIEWAVQKQCKFISVIDIFVRQKYVDECHKRGLKMFVYPLGAKAKMNVDKMRTLGVDGVILNYPPTN